MNFRSHYRLPMMTSHPATRHRIQSAVLAAVTLCASVGCMTPGLREKSAHRPHIVSVRKIWDRAPHNAFTDLVRFRKAWFCTFREGEGHVGGDGRIRVLVSKDGDTWNSAALLSEEGVDLRDPKLSVTPDGRLMLVAGGSIYRDGQFVTCRSRVAFSKNGAEWTPIRPVLPEGEWLWRVAWHEGILYGTSYRRSDTGRVLTLWSSRDGLHYEQITTLDVPGEPCEATLRFDPAGRMVALVRREGGTKTAWVGVSEKPYTRWQWHDLGQRVGGPEFTILPDGSMWAAGRQYRGKGRAVVLARMTLGCYEPVLTLPSGGDCSYPGMVFHDGMLWMSYYSSHEGKASIYLAKIRLP